MQIPQVAPLFVFAVLLTFSSSQPFYELQSLPTPNSNKPSFQCDISQDNSILTFITDDNAVYVYKKNETFYSHSQTITNNTADPEVVDITADGQWLLFI